MKCTTLILSLVAVTPLVDTPHAAVIASESLTSLSRGARYGEVLLLRRRGMKLEAEVWGTQGLNACPEANWSQLDTDAIRSATGALAVVKNGPRYWLPNATTGKPASDRRTRFGDLEMRHLATLEIQPRQGRTPYRERVVRRQTTFVFNRGEQIYELISPRGIAYVMQSWSTGVDPELAIEDLPKLGSRLQLPSGWTYQSRVLEDDLVLRAEQAAVVLQDDLRNTYQRR